MMILTFLTGNPFSKAEPTPSPAFDTYGGAILGNPNAMLAPKTHAAMKSETERFIDSQNRMYDRGSRSTADLAESLGTGEARARQVANLLKDEEFQKVLRRMTERGNTLLKENQGLKTPGAILYGAASMWFGASIRLFKGEAVKINARFEGRARKGEFTIESPLLNSKFVFQSESGLHVNLNRKIASLNSTAELNFMSKTQSLSTQVRHPLSNHLDLTIGSTQLPEFNNQTDTRAKIEYQFNF